MRVSFWENPKFLDRNGTECGIEKENGILDIVMVKEWECRFKTPLPDTV